MEIYRNQPTSVKFRAPIPDASYSVKVRSTRPLNAEHETVIPSITPQSDIGWGNGVYTLSIPVDFAHTWYDGKVIFEITVNGGTPTVQHTYTEYADVVTPLFTWADLDQSYPEADTPELERLVRKVVEAYTGQYFGKKIQRMSVDPNSQYAYFNIPLIEFTGISDAYMTNTLTLNPPKIPYESVEDGYGLRLDWSRDTYDIKTDSLWLIGNRVAPTQVIIEGVVGYNGVPQDVKEAALLIAGLWGCEQTVWRDRFIQTMRSSDWSIQYNDGAFGKSTGSQTADNLLAKYAGQGIMPEVI